jgi:hypothetical protein
MRSAYKVLIGNLKGRDHLGDGDVGTRVILKWISRKYGVRAQDRVQWELVNSNEPSGSIKGREFIYQLRDRRLIENDSAPWSLFSFEAETCSRVVVAVKWFAILPSGSCLEYVTNLYALFAQISLS